MPDARSRPERPPAERLPLGQASRLLGVDPDTLRRWADEGRVPAFTTLGGHRRFERRALERLVATRRTGAIGALGGVGDDRSPERGVPAAVRRDPTATAPSSGPSCRRRIATRSATRAGVSPKRWCATSTAPDPRERRRGRGRRPRGAARGAVRRQGSRSGPASRCSSRPAAVPRRAAAGRPPEGVNAVAVGQHGLQRSVLDRLLLVFVEAHSNAIVDDDEVLEANA